MFHSCLLALGARMLVDSIYIYLFYVTNMNLIRSPLTDDVHWFSHLLYIPWISHETTIIEPWYPHRKNWNITNWWFFASKNALNPMKSPLKSLNLHVYRWFSEPSSISPSVRRQSVPLQVQRGQSPRHGKTPQAWQSPVEAAPAESLDQWIGKIGPGNHGIHGICSMGISAS